MIDEPKDPEASGEEQEEKEELEVAKDTMADLDAPDEAAADAKGGFRSAACPE